MTGVAALVATARQLGPARARYSRPYYDRAGEVDFQFCLELHHAVRIQMTHELGVNLHLWLNIASACNCPWSDDLGNGAWSIRYTIHIVEVRKSLFLTVEY